MDLLKKHLTLFKQVGRINDILEKINVKKHFIINRQFSIESLYPYKDTLDIDYQKYMKDIFKYGKLD